MNASLILNGNNFDPKTFDFIGLVENQDFSVSTIKSYRIGIRLFFNWAFEIRGKEFSELSVYDFIEFKRWLSMEKCENTTRNSYLTGVMTLYRLLEKHGVDNICSGIKKFEPKRDYTKNGVTIEQWQKVLSVIDTKFFNGKKHYLLIYMLYISGVRQMSLRNLKWSDFGFDSNINGMVMKVKLKGSGSREESVILSLECIRFIEKFREDYCKHYGLDVDCSIPDDWYVFGNKGKILSDSGIRKIGCDYLKKAGVYEKGVVTPHSFRHGIAEHLIEKGLKLTDVQQFLCHKSINSTMVYAGKKEKLRVNKVLLGTVNEINLSSFYQ